jgi:iron(III) transport system permease protein
MVTLSAVIFLVTPETQLAAVSVLLLDDSGNQNQAAAFSVCIMLIVAVALGVFHALVTLAGRWRSGTARPITSAALAAGA